MMVYPRGWTLEREETPQGAKLWLRLQHGNGCISIPFVGKMAETLADWHATSKQADLELDAVLRPGGRIILAPKAVILDRS